MEDIWNIEIIMLEVCVWKRWIRDGLEKCRRLQHKLKAERSESDICPAEHVEVSKACCSPAEEKDL